MPKPPSLFQTHWRRLSHRSLKAPDPLTFATATVYEDPKRPGIHITVVSGGAPELSTPAGQFRSTWSGELAYEHAPEAEASDPENHARVISWMAKRVAHDVMGAVLGAAWIEKTPVTSSDPQSPF